ncbi:hypothetical protein GLYMA_20G135750v4 [Glycine max]|nr:hypothetical protein GLYMA_20G135750v4 [Glycine max]KAH1035961.1 hypothetical protein GYH30_055765 [Glycine max]
MTSFFLLCLVIKKGWARSYLWKNFSLLTKKKAL